MEKQNLIKHYLNEIDKDLDIISYLETQRDETDERLDANIKALNKLDETAFEHYLKNLEAEDSKQTAIC